MAIFPGSAIPSAVSDYEIENSLRFEDADDSRLTKTIATSGNQKTITISFWFKRGNLGLNNTRLFSSRTSGSDEFEILLNTSNQLSTYFYSGSYSFWLLTTQLFRDPSAWYHYCLKYDSTPASPDSTNCSLYINGVQVTAFETETYPSQNLELPVNKATASVTIGDHGGALGSYVWDGYIAEWYSIDGQALDADSFGELDSTTNQWKPLDSDDVKDAVTFGTNGFYQKYSSTELANSFTDSSGGAFTGSDFSAVTSSMTFSVASVASIIDGTTTPSSGCIPTGSQTVSGQDVTFDCGSGVTKIFTHAEFILSNTYDDGAWKWQGSNDDISYSDIGSGNFTVQGSVAEGPPIDITAGLSSNTTAYRYYRWLGVSGTTTASNYWTEIVNLKTAPPGTGFHTITANGDVKNVRGVGNFECETLVVGGGGSAGGPGSGGGGGGGMRTGTTNLWNGESYTITVGAGGAGTVGETNGNNGGDSKLGNIITAAGGGYGGRSAQGGNEGGAGGGAGYAGAGGGGNTPSTSPSQGAGGGAGGPSGGGAANSHSGGGGGGGGASGTAGAAGSNVSGSGNGGNGTASSISGSSVTYGGGGGGGTIYFFYSGSGGTGGGGDAGPTANTDGSDGTDGLGGGGGGGSGTSTSLSGGDGGSGIVIIRYKSATNLATGGTITTDGDYKVHTFTTDGTFAPTSATRPGSSSIEFDGTGDYLTAPDSTDWAFGTDNFTVEFWMNHQSIATGNVGITFSPTADHRQIFGYVDAGDGLFKIYLTSNGSSWDIASGVSMGTATLGAWTHYAIVRSGTSFYTFQNGTQISTFTDSDSMYDSSDALSIGRYASSTYLDGYMDEIRISDSARYTSAFTPQTTQFTADANTKLLIHSNWDGGLGADSSGNYNTFTPTNLVATDQMVDTPTNNFATINPLVPPNGTNTFSEGNLKSVAGSGWQASVATISASSGKWYYETLCGGSNQHCYIIGAQTERWFSGVASPQDTATGTIGYMGYDGNKRIDTVDTSYGATFGSGDIIAVALDLDAGTPTVTFYKNNVSQGAITFTGNILNSSIFVPAFATLSQTTYYNFGSDSSFAGEKTAQGNQDGNDKGDFYYTPPSGYLALCADNLSAPEIALPGENFNTVAYQGNGSSLSITGLGFQPDLVWAKNRTGTYATRDHKLFNSVNGATNYLESNTTDIEASFGTGVSFDSDGFTLNGDYGINPPVGTTTVAWSWKAGGAPTVDNSAGAGATPTAGSVKIDGSNLGSALAGTLAATRISANTTAGFSTVKYAGNNTSGATVAHGLSETPELIIIKNTEAVVDWIVYSEPVGPTKGLQLNGTGDAYDYLAYFNDTSPTPSVFSLGNYSGVNANTQDMIAYCFHSVEGYSKIGSYVTVSGAATNGLGNFIYTGFKPAWFLNKMISGPDGAGGWFLYDNKRNAYNLTGTYLVPSANYADEVATQGWDFLSNGIKLRASFSANTHIYMAFAENPFKYSNAR